MAIVVVIDTAVIIVTKRGAQVIIESMDELKVNIPSRHLASVTTPASLVEFFVSRIEEQIEANKPKRPLPPNLTIE